MVKVEALHLFGEDDRGATFGFDCDREGPFIYAMRKAGSVSGRHFHKGLSKTKNPEILILLQGAMTLELKDVRTGESETKQIEAPVRLTIPPFIWHKITATADLHFVELNSMEAHAADTFYTDTLVEAEA